LAIAVDPLFGWPGYYYPNSYAYPPASYPYPYTYYAPTAAPVTIIQQIPPAAVYAPVPDPMPVAVATLPAYYYCNNPKGYYPYVQSCHVSWQTVPATPPGPSR